jgi:hypothetical protein
MTYFSRIAPAYSCFDFTGRTRREKIRKGKKNMTVRDIFGHNACVSRYSILRAAAVLLAACCAAGAVTACRAGGGAADKTSSAASVSSSKPAVSSAPSAVSAAGTAYTSQAGGFTVTYPAGWSLTEGTDGAVCTFTSPKSSPTSPIKSSVSAGQPLGGNKTLYALNSARLSRLEKSEKQYELVANDNIKLSGTVGYKIDYKSLKNSVTQRTVVYFALIGSKEYVFIATAPAASYDDYASDFAETLKTLTVK